MRQWNQKNKELFQDALAKGIDNKQKSGNSHFVHYSKSQSMAFHLITKAKGIPVPILYLPVLLRKTQQTAVQTKTALTKQSTTTPCFYKKYLPLHYYIIQVWRLAIHCDFLDSLGLLLAC